MKILVGLLTSLVTEKFLSKMLIELAIWASAQSTNKVDDRLTGHLIEALGFKKEDFKVS